MELAIIIVVVVQVILLITFFVMAANVAKIKRQTTKVKPSIGALLAQAKEEAYVGNKEKARELLMRAKYDCEVIHAQRKSIYLYDDDYRDRSSVLQMIEEQLSLLNYINPSNQ